MQNILNESDFVLDDKPTVIKFWATWCAPCKKLSPVIEKLESEFSNVKFVSIDIEQVPVMAQKYKVRSLPSVVFIKNKAEAQRIVGLAMVEPLRKAIRDISAG